MFRFAIKPNQKVTKSVRCLLSGAKVFVQITINGVPAPLDVAIGLREGDDCIQLCRTLANHVTSHMLHLSGWGTFGTESLAQSDHLMALKGTLPTLVKKLAHMLTPATPTAQDLLSEAPTTKPLVRAFYEFTDAVVETVDVECTEPGAVYFTTLAAVPKAQIVGQAGELTVEYNPTIFSTTKRYAFSHFGQLAGVEAMLERFPHETVRAAFLDLARNLLAQDDMASECETWSAVAKTELKLVE